MSVVFTPRPAASSASFAGRPLVDWSLCHHCGIMVCDFGEFVVETDRNGFPLDVEHECNLV